MASPDVDRQRLRLALDNVLKPVQHLFVDRDRLTGYQLIARGGFGSVSTARLRAHPESNDFQIVAVKELLPMGNDVQRIKLSTSFARELRVWAMVDHPNVLPLTGFYLDTNATVALFITPFEPHGNLRWYLERALTSDVMLDDTRRLELAADTASGLFYLHTQQPPICHGDIKSLNVLITPDGRAKLCDFGLAKIIEDHPSGLTTAGFELANTAFYMSYELACVPGALRTLMSDVWAWGGVSLEIFTGKTPYGHCKSDMQVYGQIFSGVLPAALESLVVSDRIRVLLRRCWEKTPGNRISMAESCHILAEEKLSLAARQLRTSGGHDPSFSPDDFEIDESSIHNLPFLPDGVEISEPSIHDVPQVYEDTPQPDHVLSELLERLSPYRLTGDMLQISETRAFREGSAQIYPGKMQKAFRWASAGDSVEVEVFPTYQKDSVDWIQNLSMHVRQMELWARLDHPNVLPFLGLEVDEENAVVQWVVPCPDNGRLNRYIECMELNLTELAKLSLDVARGILYLHTLNPAIAHGDLRARNILVNWAGQAIISNFLYAENILDKPPPRELSGSMRWFSPELHDGESCSLQSDIWAWGCLLIEIFLSHLPFQSIQNPSVLIDRVSMKKDPPAAPEELSSLPAKLRQHMETCWKFVPEERPTIQEGLEVLNDLIEGQGNSQLVQFPVSDGSTPIVNIIQPLVQQPPSRPAYLETLPLGTSGESSSTSTTRASTFASKSDSGQRGKKDRLARVKRFFGGPPSGSD